ncbi:AzlD domain-containing protein [Antrihabitans cavernicola]|uniref:AzlD domain-containing protein n=1 Tax=Antrihabitans cavernicola TaxID=2495913 RepID=A0A5A7S8G5_9NOCA|nr:AzlD domain-containing protein [Spelaeibacter cavernicola]KAA0021442.1 AzlD domain-containing protein [Spelaeibacter cavernicola]
MSLLVAVIALAAGTFAIRLAGPVLRERTELSPWLERTMTDAAVVLICAVTATAALMEAQTFAGVARPVGVIVGGVLAWRKAPFVLIVLAAAATAAGLRAIGVP